MDKNKIRLVVFDLDGTLTQHKTPLSEEHKQVLNELEKKYKLLMAGAGTCQRIFNQMNQYPIDIIGNYGLQYAEYNSETKDIEIKKNVVLPCDRESVEKRVTAMREKYGYTELPVVLHFRFWEQKRKLRTNWYLTRIVRNAEQFMTM